MLLMLLLLTFSKDTFGQTDSEICSIPFRETCPGSFPVQLPGSSEELDELCPTILEHLACAQKYGKECWEDDDPEDFSRDIKYTKDICDKDSKTHKDAVHHLPCIKEVSRKTAKECFNLTQDFIEENKHQIPVTHSEGDDSSLPAHQRCLESVHLLTCFLSFFEMNCDPGVVDVVLDAYHRTSILNYFCGREIEEQLLKIVDTLKTELEKKYLVELLTNNFV